MTLDFNFFTNFLLIYLFLFTGVFLKYFVKINEQIIGKFLIYFLAPIVIFHGTLHTTLISNILFLPILIFLKKSIMLSLQRETEMRHATMECRGEKGEC